MTLIDDIKRDREAGTDGPWCRDCWDILSLGGPGTGHVAEISKPNGDDDNYWQKGEADANARRIARVPRMEAALLAAEECERVLTAMANRVSLYSGGHDDKLVNNAEEALAAFRKALQCEED